MNEKQKDKGLMKGVKEQPQFRLTSVSAVHQLYFPHHAESRGSYTLT